MTTQYSLRAERPHVITQVLSSAVVYMCGGPLADRLALKISRVRGSVDREPEYQLPNLIVPFISAMVGCAIFGCAQHFNLHVAVLLTGSFFISIGTMTSFTILKTFTIESYPHWPGPVLVNVSTYRSSSASPSRPTPPPWVQERGPLLMFGVYIACLFVISGSIPLFYFYGKQFRYWTAGRVGKLLNEEGSGGSPIGLATVVSSVTVASDEKSLVGADAKNMTKITSTVTVDSIDKHAESQSTKSSIA